MSKVDASWYVGAPALALSWVVLFVWFKVSKEEESKRLAKQLAWVALMLFLTGLVLWPIILAAAPPP